MNKGMWLISFLLITGGLAVLVYAGIIRAFRRRNERYGGRVQAKIVRLALEEVPGSASGFRNAYFPVLEYYAQGKLFTQLHDEGSYPSNCRVGQKLELAYDPQDPSDYIILPRTVKGSLPTLLYCAGVAMITAGTIIFICFAFRT